MIKGRETLPIDQSGNGRRLRTIVIDQADAFMMAHAMMIASNAAMMCNAPDAMRRLNFYREQFMAMAPVEAALFARDTALSEMAIAMADATSWRLRRVRPVWRRYGQAPAVVEIGGKTWKTRDDVDEQTLDAIAAMIESIAPTGCVRDVQPADHEIVAAEPYPAQHEDH